MKKDFKFFEFFRRQTDAHVLGINLDAQKYQNFIRSHGFFCSDGYPQLLADRQEGGHVPCALLFGRVGKEEVIKIMDKKRDPSDERNDPRKCFCKFVENKRRTAATERQPGISVKGTEPLEAEKRPLGRHNRTDTKGMFDVDFAKPCLGTNLLNNSYRVVKIRKLTCELFLRNTIVDRITARRGQVEDETY